MDDDPNSWTFKLVNNLANAMEWLLEDDDQPAGAPSTSRTTADAPAAPPAASARRAPAGAASATRHEPQTPPSIGVPRIVTEPPRSPPCAPRASDTVRAAPTSAPAHGATSRRAGEPTPQPTDGGLVAAAPAPAKRSAPPHMTRPRPLGAAGAAAELEALEMVAQSRWRCYWLAAAAADGAHDAAVPSAAAASGCVRATEQLTALVHAGVPAADRVAFWCACIGADARGAIDSDRDSAVDPYAALVALAGAGGAPALALAQIEKDLNRTFAGVACVRIPEDEATSALRRVLRAYAAREPAIGYCQAMNFVCAVPLLCGLDEERAFWLIVRLLGGGALRGYYGPAMEGAVADQVVFANALCAALPALATHLARLGVSVSLVSTGWFLCAYACVLPLPALLRAWDLLLYAECATDDAQPPAAGGRGRRATAPDPTGGSRVLHHLGIELIRQQAHALLACTTLEDAYAVLAAAGSRADTDALLESVCAALRSAPVDGPRPIGLGRPLAQLRAEALAELPAALVARMPAPPARAPADARAVARAPARRGEPSSALASPRAPPTAVAPCCVPVAAKGACDGACDGVCGQFECVAYGSPPDAPDSPFARAPLRELAAGAGGGVRGLSFIIMQLAQPSLIEGYFHTDGRAVLAAGKYGADAAGATGRAATASKAMPPPPLVAAASCGATLASVRLRLDSLSHSVIDNYALFSAVGTPC
jgi:hypothetical protein